MKAAIVLACLSFSGVAFAEVPDPRCRGNYTKGLESANSGNCTLAIPLFKEVIHACPEWDVVYHDLGLCYAMGKDYNAAIKQMSEAVRLSPTKPSYQHALGQIYAQKGDWERAIDQVNILWDIDLRSALAFANEIVIVRASTGVKAASATTEWAIQVPMTAKNPQVTKLLMAAIEAFQQNRFSEAERLVNQAIAMDPSEPSGYIYLALVYDAADESERALKTLETGLEQNPKNPIIISMLGQRYFISGKRQIDAASMWEKLKTIDRTSYKAYEKIIPSCRQASIHSH